MIDECSTLICYVRPNSYRSGAKTIMNYAKRKGLKIINLYKEDDEYINKLSKEEREQRFKLFINSNL